MPYKFNIFTGKFDIVEECEWTDTGTVIHPTELTDDVSLGSATPTNSAKFSIDGDDDQVQASIQANATQTEDILVVEKSDGTCLFRIEGLGEVDIIHTAGENDDRSLEIDTNAAAHGDVKALDINYITGAIVKGEDEGIVLINIDETAALGGDIFGVEVLTTEAEGPAEVYGMKAGALVGPIHQDSGTFENPTTATNNTTGPDDVDAMKDEDSETTTAIFQDNIVNEYILIGAAAPFEEIEFIITTGASGAGIKPTFGYSIDGAHTFTAFSPVDGTNGFRNTGVIAWDASDLTDHDTNDNTGTYDILITRTRNSLSTTPVLGYAKVATTTEYVWDKTGALNILSLDVAGNIVLTGTVDGIDVATDVAANTTHRGTTGNQHGHDTHDHSAALDTAVAADLNDITSPGADIEDAVTKKHTNTLDHTQGTDTTLGTMTQDIDMDGSYQVVGLQAPAAAGEALRQTTNITEADLEQLTDGSQTALHSHAGGGGDLLADGSIPLTSDWDIGDGRKIQADEIQARNGAGLKLTEDGGQGIFIENGGFIGIWNTDPTVMFDMGSATNSAMFRLLGADGDRPSFATKSHSNTPGHGSEFAFRRARGTSASPDAVVNNDYIFIFDCFGYDGSAYKKCSGLSYLVDGIVSTNIVPSKIHFRTMDDAGVLTKRMVIRAEGSVTIGNNFETSNAMLEIAQNSTTGAKPVLRLWQDDISEEFIKFRGDTASGVLTQSLVAAGDVGTFTPTGYVKVNLIDDGTENIDGACYMQVGTLS